jgi:histone H3/H4
LIAIHCERKTLTSKDILLVKKIRNEMFVNNIQ